MSSSLRLVDSLLFGAPLSAGALRVSLADDPGLLVQAQDLRARAFGLGAPDTDRFDRRALHLVAQAQSGAVLGAVRLVVQDGASLTQGYAGGLYDLRALAALPGKTLEMGRLCLHPDFHNPDLLRLMLAGVARVVETTGAARLLGCVSFSGTDVARIAPALALLHARHVGPADLRPDPRADEWIPLPPPALVPGAMAILPPALRFYLSLGAWVSDHAVIDRDMGTIHVLCVLDVDAMPSARRERLRAMARG